MAISGKLGAGKTLALTYFAYRKYLQGRDIFTNYPLNFPKMPLGSPQPNITMLRTIQDVLKMRSGYGALDELWASCDSRESMKNKNTLVSNILLKSRKRDIHFGFTSQEFGQIDKRLRDQTEFYAEPELSKNESFCRVYVYSVIKGRTGSLQRTFKFATLPFFRMFDTNYEVEPFYDETEKQDEEKEEDRSVTDIDEELGDVPTGFDIEE